MQTNYTRPLSLFAATLTAVKRHQTLGHLLHATTRLYVVAVVAAHGGNIEAAARTAGLSTKQLTKMWRFYLQE